ncbi:Ribosomal RNA large subunit methyltransferase H [Gracilariopsis chorda]|uniref:Ribosomal RNA large subunit methyltransferase H n=1 Tax=Gracilariopsis chorda TaxID=448386 RepID=A0A2V3IZ75_9FLOR|nr:Ribosomal RNA large subunit methyltransferase H [Gracilariopsis chorda]|eukprot:PXF47375.1 Ribosomal RNA large subunit methyltransferase H [Gracilariopsis chorda]
MLLVRPYIGAGLLGGSFVRNKLCTTKEALKPVRHAKSATFHAKLKVQLITIGKRSGKDAVFDPLVAEYTKRMSNVISISERSVKRESATALVAELSKREAVMLMDEHGPMPRDSIHFSEMIFAALERGGSRLSMIVGDADGLPLSVLEVQNSRVQKVSLSPLTFTHKMARLFIYEQLYRATEIRNNSKYHK